MPLFVSGKLHSEVLAPESCLDAILTNLRQFLEAVLTQGGLESA